MVKDEQQTEVPKRDQTMPAASIDEEYIARLARETWEQSEKERDTYILRRELYEASWRQLDNPDFTGPWENAANFHVPVALTYGKAAHARLWQLFSNQNGFFNVEARQEIFRDKEVKIKQFMDWVWENWANSKIGCRREMDRWLWDIVLSGSGFLKCFWKKEVRRYVDVQTIIESYEELTFDPAELTGARTDYKTRAVQKNVEKEEILETPQVRRILYEDITMPIGAADPQEAHHVVTRVYMTDDDLKHRVDQKVFFEEAVEESINARVNPLLVGDQGNELKQQRVAIDGLSVDGSQSQESDRHVILEYYGPAFVQPEVTDVYAEAADLKKTKQEIVAWVHWQTRKVLGWTYLSRISPSGLRPIFKADFISFPDRTQGVGVAEVLYDIGRNIDAVYNLRVDNGTLASIPMFAYRASSSLKPALMRIRPGTGIPVDDVNDLRQFQFPFLTGFGYQEEGQLTGYAEKLLAVSELNLGRAPEKVGALRNATGSNLIASESGIQLEIHFDRIAHTLSRLLQCMFQLCRERMPEKLYFRVTGDTGKPIFGEVNRQDLYGEYDFRISVDILGQSQLEKQQQSVMMMQTLMNPMFTQTGTVTPTNIYNLGKNFLKAYRVGRVDDYLTPPPDYQGPAISPLERISRIVMGAIDGIEGTVRLQDNHEEALKAYEDFQQSDMFGLLTQPAQIAAFQGLIQKTMQMMEAQLAGGNPNLAGMQVPRGGFGAVNAQMGGGGETLSPQQMGVPNGPVV